MTIRDRILDVIASQPGGVGLQTIRAHLQDCSHAGVNIAVSEICRDGLIERVGHGRYRLPAPKIIPATPSVTTGGDFIQRPSLARLMAGR